jgi:hypothetical protein
MKSMHSLTLEKLNASSSRREKLSTRYNSTQTTEIDSQIISLKQKIADLEREKE